MLMRPRDRIIRERTRTANQMRSFAAEYGLCFPKNISALVQGLTNALTNEQCGLSPVPPNQFAIRAEGGLRWGGTGIASTSSSPAFTEMVNTASNTCDSGSGVANSRMIATHPLLNGNPNAVVLFSANFGTLTAGGGAPPRNPLAIYYSDVVNGTCPAGRWIIYQTSVTAEVLNNNSRYNIWFVLP